MMQEDHDLEGRIDKSKKDGALIVWKVATQKSEHCEVV